MKMNKIILLGRLTKDIEIRNTQGGMAIGRTCIAVDRRAKAGEQKESDFFNVTAFGKTAELMEKYSGKGRRVLIEGRIQNSKYKDKQGTERIWTEVIVENFYFADDKKEKASDPNDPFPGGEEVNPADMPF